MSALAKMEIRDISPAAGMSGAATTVRQIDALIAQLSEIRDCDPLADIAEGLSVARAWAKIQEDSESLRHRLLRLELHVFRQIGILGAARQVFSRSTQKSSAARFLSCLTFDDVEALAVRWASSTTATGVVYAEKRNQEGLADAERGRRHATGGFTPPRPRSREEAATLESLGMESDSRVRRASDVTAAVALLVDDYASRHMPFTIAEMADELMLDLDLDDAYRNGIRMVCRDAINRADIEVQGGDLPLFVTCQAADETALGGYVRIPFAAATPAQLDEMIALREEQIRQDQAALVRMKGVRALVASVGVGETALIGEYLDAIKQAAYVGDPS